MRIVREMTVDQQSNAENFPLMVAHPSLSPMDLERAREGLGLPGEVIVLLSPLCPPVQAFRINQMHGWEWAA